MSFIRYIFIFFWRLWFYIIMFLTIFLMFPFLVIIISREKWYPFFFKLAHYWGKLILFLMGFKTKVTQEEEIEPGQSYVFCPNHTSMIDIMLMLAITDQPFVFLGKEELADIPVFGYIYKKTCILVNREDQKSKTMAVEQAKNRLKKGLSVCIFPEGKVPDDESVILDEFQNGAFRLASEFEIPVVPITFYDCKKRFSYTFFSGGPGILRVKIHEFLNKKGDGLKRETLKKLTRQTIEDELLANHKNQIVIPLKNQ